MRFDEQVSAMKSQLEKEKELCYQKIQSKQLNHQK
jgi:hypothetical protein